MVYASLRQLSTITSFSNVIYILADNLHTIIDNVSR